MVTHMRINKPAFVQFCVYQHICLHGPRGERYLDPSCWSEADLISPSVCSFKFGRKINYVSYLSELEDVVKCDQLIIPARVRE